MTAVLEVEHLSKTYRFGFWKRKTDVLHDVSFRVEPGETFGFLGPNGAGKTTTIKAIVRLIHPTEGRISMFGEPIDDFRLARRLGYLPENPYLYQYLKPIEFLNLCAAITYVPTQERKKRIDMLIEQVGLAHATDRPIGKFSKGMMQRMGLAQALLHDPEFLILDEPMSGLDPVGRREVRELILEQKHKGKTVLFTSHILNDVEQLCDRVCILSKGRMRAQGRLDELLSSDDRSVELLIQDASATFEQRVSSLGTIKKLERGLQLTLTGDDALHKTLCLVTEHRARLVSLTPHRTRLEDLFVTQVEANPNA